MSGETVASFLADNPPWVSSPDSPPGEALSFASSFGCVFQTSAGRSLGTLSAGKGSLVDEERLSLDLTFSLEPDGAGTAEFSGTLVLTFEGEGRPSD